MTRTAVLFLLALASAALASSVQFVVVNSTQSDITSIQVRPSGGPWLWSHEMLLGDRPLPPGAGDPYLQVDDDHGALWDVKIVTPDGEFTFCVLNLSKLPILTLTHFSESGLWILTPDRPENPLPEMDDAAAVHFREFWIVEDTPL